MDCVRGFSPHFILFLRSYYTLSSCLLTGGYLTFIFFSLFVALRFVYVFDASPPVLFWYYCSSIFFLFYFNFLFIAFPMNAHFLVLIFSLYFHEREKKNIPKLTHKYSRCAVAVNCVCSFSSFHFFLLFAFRFVQFFVSILCFFPQSNTTGKQN